MNGLRTIRWCWKKPRIRFYAGQPLKADGSPVGVFCLMDYQPRSPSAEDLQLFQDLATLVEDHLSLIETRKLQREIQEHQRTERRLGMQYAVTRILAASATLDEAAPKMLQAVCESLEWDVGLIWNLDRTNQLLRCIECWHRPAVRVPEFEARSRQRTFSPGIGLPGRVWSSGKPAWIPDVTQDANFPRAAVAVQEGLHGAFAFPILLGQEMLGVVEFFSHAIQQPDQELLQATAALGSQIGQFIERMWAEQALRSAKDAAEPPTGPRVSFWPISATRSATPMNGILGMTELVLNTDLTPAQREYLGLVKDSADALLTVNHDLLDFSKIEAGKVDLEVG